MAAGAAPNWQRAAAQGCGWRACAAAARWPSHQLWLGGSRPYFKRSGPACQARKQREGYCALSVACSSLTAAEYGLSALSLCCLTLHPSRAACTRTASRRTLALRPDISWASFPYAASSIFMWLAFTMTSMASLFVLSRFISADFISVGVATAMLRETTRAALELIAFSRSPRGESQWRAWVLARDVLDRDLGIDCQLQQVVAKHGWRSLLSAMA